MDNTLYNVGQWALDVFGFNFCISAPILVFLPIAFQQIRRPRIDCGISGYSGYQHCLC